MLPASGDYTQLLVGCKITAVDAEKQPQEEREIRN